jgi:tRNA A58 N-methylase Trm61
MVRAERTRCGVSRGARCPMSNDEPILPKTIEALAEAPYASFGLLAGMELDLFTPLKDGPLDAEAIAIAARTDPAKTVHLLHALVAIGMMRFDGDRFSNTPEADRYLVRGRAEYIGTRHHAYRRRWESMLRVGDSVRTGKPQRGMDYAVMSSELCESFYRGTFTECLAAGQELATRLDLSKRHRLVDVGGGSGGLSVAMAEAWPHLEITLADLPSAAAVAERYIDEAGLKSVIRIRPTDIVTGRLEGTYDVAIMRGLIPVLAPEQARAALKNVHQALEPGSPLYVVGWILDDTRSTPLLYATYNLLFMNDYESALIRTEAEHRLWLREAGFSDICRDRQSATYAADYIVARKA